MTTEHITQEQIEAIYTRYGGDMANCAHSIARQAVANYIKQRAKELPVFPVHDIYSEEGWERSDECIKEWGLQCAAQARGVALEEASDAVNDLSYDAMRGDCVATIEALKAGK